MEQTSVCELGWPMLFDQIKIPSLSDMCVQVLQPYAKLIDIRVVVLSSTQEDTKYNGLKI